MGVALETAKIRRYGDHACINTYKSGCLLMIPLNVRKWCGGGKREGLWDSCGRAKRNLETVTDGAYRGTRSKSASSVIWASEGDDELEWVLLTCLIHTSQ